MTLLKRILTILWTSTILHEAITKSATMTINQKEQQSYYKFATNNTITDIDVQLKLYNKKIVQLIISWQDNLPKGSSYNVIVNAQNTSSCSDPPCHLYGVKKPDLYVLLPNNPLSYVDPLECNFMFGCNYLITVETINTLVAHHQQIFVPDCVFDNCICHIRSKLPIVHAKPKLLNKESMQLNWSIELNNTSHKKNLKKMFNELSLYKLYVSVTEQSNPTLPWGGILVPVLEKFYALKDVSFVELQNSLHGSIYILLNKPVTEKATVKLYIVDAFGCAGKENVLHISASLSVENDESKQNFLLIVISTLFGVVFVLTSCICLIRRRNKRRNIEISLNPFTSSMIPIRMEENVNYVDKYIEQSQILGLANEFEVPHSSISMGPEIGEGAFGRVYKATALNLRHMWSTTVVAVKQLKRNPASDEIAEFLSEIEMLKGVGQHRNIVCFLGCCTIRSPYLMIMEYVGRGNLLSYLRTVRSDTIKSNLTIESRTKCVSTSCTNDIVKYIELSVSEEIVYAGSVAKNEVGQPKPSVTETMYTIVEDEIEQFKYILDNRELHNFARQIANGMRFLDDRGITHRYDYFKSFFMQVVKNEFVMFNSDLAARNILIDDHKTLKISDFGLSRHGIYMNTKARKLPLRWLSIEAIRDNIYSSKSDVWAYGVVLWEIGTLGALPYYTISNDELVSFLLSGRRLERPEICTEQVYTLMLQCWAEMPNARPTFEELYKAVSPQMNYVDINKLSDDYVFPPIKETTN